MSQSLLKIVDPILMTTESNSPIYIYKGQNSSSPVLAYKQNSNIVYLNGDGSPINRLLTCKQLKLILSDYTIRGTKFIGSVYNPTLYYLFPGEYDNYGDEIFNIETNFVPYLIIPWILRNEVDGFDVVLNSDDVVVDSAIVEESVNSIKACDSWYDDPELADEITRAIDARINEIFGSYNDFSQDDIEKEVERIVGRYSVDITSDPYVFNLLSPGDYTDTINLEDWIYASERGEEISGKLDISYMYSYNGNLYSGSQTIRAFRYTGSSTDSRLILGDSLIDLGSIQIEFLNKVLKIYPKITSRVDEVSFTDCVLTIGKLV